MNVALILFPLAFPHDLITNHNAVHHLRPAPSRAPCAIKGRCLRNEVIRVNSKNGDVCTWRGKTKCEWDNWRGSN